jgi:HK97 family phage major capsid protein
VTAGTLSSELYAYLIDAVYAHPADVRRRSRWVMSTEWLLECRKMTDGRGRTLWEPSISVSGPELLLGYAIEVREDGGAPHLEEVA